MPLRFAVDNLAALLERPVPQGLDAAVPPNPPRDAQADMPFVAANPPAEWSRYLPTYAQVGKAWTGLCSAAQPITQRKFATEMTPCHSSMTELGLERTIEEHNATEYYLDRLNLFDNFNNFLSPRIRLEESFLQILAQRFAYTGLNVSTAREPYWLDCHVTTDLRDATFGNPSHRYHGSYHVYRAERNPLGCTAFWFEPGKTPGLHANTAPRIILFRGTYNHDKRDVLAQQAPTGWATNLDPDNIGHRAFSSSRNTLVSWVDHCLRNDQRVVITGHSLGGAHAQQLMAALTPAQQAGYRLVTFGAPGVAQETVDRIRSESATEKRVREEAKLPSPIKMIWHEADPVVHLFGECYPSSEGTRVIARVEWNEMIQTHSRLYILVAEAWRGEIYYREEERPRIRIVALEYFRQYFGRFVTTRITADWPFH